MFMLSIDIVTFEVWIYRCMCDYCAITTQKCLDKCILLFVMLDQVLLYLAPISARHDYINCYNGEISDVLCQNISEKYCKSYVDSKKFKVLLVNLKTQTFSKIKASKHTPF